MKNRVGSLVSRHFSPSPAGAGLAPHPRRSIIERPILAVSGITRLHHIAHCPKTLLGRNQVEKDRWNRDPPLYSSHERPPPRWEHHKLQRRRPHRAPQGRIENTQRNKMSVPSPG